MTDKCLVRVVNALEGYRIGLECVLEKENRSLLERLYLNTLVTAKEYHFPVQPYERWYEKYNRTKMEVEKW